MTKLKDKFWMWGYTQGKIPEEIPFVRTPSYCSLETAAQYFGMGNVVFMNGMHNIENINDQHLGYLKNFNRVVCGLPHGENTVQGALKVSEMSLQFPNISGAILDDFLQVGGHPMNIERMRDIRNALKSRNPALELYVVYYSDIDHEDLTPYLEYIDVINLWRWVSTEHFWRAESSPYIIRLKRETGKRIIQGVYLQNYGEAGSSNPSPMDMGLWELQWLKIFNMLSHGITTLQEGHYHILDGCVLLQNGCCGHPAFREQVIWLKNNLDWFLGTNTDRN